MRAQGICSVCGATVGVKPGDVAVQHTRPRRHSYGATRCDGSGTKADVPTWLAREQATAGDVVGAAEGRRQRARADYDADLARIATNVAEAEATLRALATLTAKRGAR